MIITLGRQHGSNGHDIARALAKELDYRCFDKEIVDEAAENSHFSKEIFDSYDAIWFELLTHYFVYSSPPSSIYV